jgi:hypothetical protein
MAAQQPLKGIDPGHGMGIASLITSLLGLGLVGVILGFIAMSKSKKAGLKGNTLGLVGVILGFMSMIAGIVTAVILLSGLGAVKEAVVTVQNDTLAISRTNALHSKLEEYYNENNSYPKNISLGIFPGIDSAALQDVSGGAIKVADGTAKTRSEASATQVSGVYEYIPYSCVGNNCAGYILRVDIENTNGNYSDPYVKNGLMNP